MPFSFPLSSMTRQTSATISLRVYSVTQTVLPSTCRSVRRGRPMALWRVWWVTE